MTVSLKIFKGGTWGWQGNIDMDGPIFFVSLILQKVPHIMEILEGWPIKLSVYTPPQTFIWNSPNLQHQKFVTLQGVNLLGSVYINRCFSLLYMECVQFKNSADKKGMYNCIKQVSEHYNNSTNPMPIPNNINM